MRKDRRRDGAGAARELDFDRFPLYGALPLEEQIRAVEMLSGKKVVAVVCGRNINLELFKKIIQ